MTHYPRFALLALGLALAGGAFAQSQSTPSQPATGQHMHAMDAQQQLQHLTKQLQLTADQQAKIGPILQSRDQQIQALRADTSLSQSDRRAKMMTIVQDSTKQVDALLTDTQRAQWKAMREKAMEHVQEHRGQGVPSSSGSSGG